MSEAATALRGAAKITLCDLHLDAKLYTHPHPYGTGSLRAESDRVSMSEYLKNRLFSLQHDFRRSTVWSFQSLDRLIKNDLYFNQPSSTDARCCGSECILIESVRGRWNRCCGSE